MEFCIRFAARIGGTSEDGGTNFPPDGMDQITTLFFCRVWYYNRRGSTIRWDTSGHIAQPKFLEHSVQGEEFESLPKTGSDNLQYVIECFVDDYIYLAISTSKEKLRHVENSVMKGIRNVFPADANDDEDSILLKMIKNGRHNGTWKRRCWGFNFMTSKRKSGWQPRNVTPYCSRYLSGFEVQTKDNDSMALAPSTSNNCSQSRQNFAMYSSPYPRKMDCLARSIESSLLR